MTTIRELLLKGMEQSKFGPYLKSQKKHMACSECKYRDKRTCQVCKPKKR